MNWKRFRSLPVMNGFLQLFPQTRWNSMVIFLSIPQWQIPLLLPAPCIFPGITVSSWKRGFQGSGRIPAVIHSLLLFLLQFSVCFPLSLYISIHRKPWISGKIPRLLPVNFRSLPGFYIPQMIPVSHQRKLFLNIQISSLFPMTELWQQIFPLRFIPKMKQMIWHRITLTSNWKTLPEAL